VLLVLLVLLETPVQQARLALPVQLVPLETLAQLVKQDQRAILVLQAKLVPLETPAR